MLLIDRQPVEPDTRYYLYIPEDYFLDEGGNTNAGAYIEIRFGHRSFSEKILNGIFGLFDPSFPSGITNSADGTT